MAEIVNVANKSPLPSSNKDAPNIANDASLSDDKGVSDNNIVSTNESASKVTLFENTLIYN